MYSVADYGRMAGDGFRMDAYTRAIAQAVRPGSVVLDLGAGTGIMSLLAVRQGARRVHAVDPNPAVWLAAELAGENGFADKVVVHQASSLEMAVPEPVDVVISDMRGATPLLGQNFPALADVRARWLAPGGVIMPKRDRLEVGLVEAAAVERWLTGAVASFEGRGFRAETARRSIRNQSYGDSEMPLASSDLLSTAETWAELEYGLEHRRTLEGEVALAVVRGGRATGLAIWFETEIVPGISFTTAPGQSVVYNRLYLPLLEPVDVAVGDQARVTVRADIQGERWGWDTRIEREGVVLWQHRQATFLGLPTALPELVRSAETSTPKLGPRGAQVLRILQAMDGTRTIADIAAAEPARAVSDENLERVRSLAMHYGL
jgi:protein arginine N-methyltransferase 1